MALAEAVSGLLTKEWARFVEGVQQLDPAAQASARIAAGRIPGADGAPKSINIPGWDDVIKITPAHPITASERQEARDARAEGRASRNSPAATAQIARNAAVAQRIATSAQPDYMQAWGAILTAIDNVQDLASTISTLGRLTLWGATRVPGIVGAVSPAAAAALIRVGAPLGARAVPGIGVILLVSDLLNMLGLWGTGASVLYALLCGGAPGALAAGFPPAVFKRSLKQDVWNKAFKNPFGRTAQAKRLLKAASGRVGFGDFVEAAQTSESLFGVGLSFGAIVGLLAETAASVELVARGVPVQVNAPIAYEKAGKEFSGWIAQQTTADVIAARQAAAVLATAPSIARVQAHFTDEEHLLVMLILTHCVGVLMPWTARIDLDEALVRVMDEPLTVPRLLSAGTIAALIDAGVDVNARPRWWLDGFPTTATAAQLIDDGGRMIGPAAKEFMLPRRWSVEGDLFATLTSQLAENLWLLLTRDPEFFRWKLAADSAITASLFEDGLILSNQDPPANLWRFWLAARELHDARGGPPQGLAMWQSLARSTGVTLIPLLPPGSPWPAAWADQARPE